MYIRVVCVVIPRGFYLTPNWRADFHHITLFRATRRWIGSFDHGAPHRCLKHAVTSSRISNISAVSQTILWRIDWQRKTAHTHHTHVVVNRARVAIYNFRLVNARAHTEQSLFIHCGEKKENDLIWL